MRERWNLLKADMDRYCSNPDFSDVRFPKGKSNFCYVIKLLILFFVKQDHCFRAILYRRMGRISYPIKLIFPVKFRDVFIGCQDFVGGGIYFAHPWGTVLNCEHIGYGCSFLQNTTLGNKLKNGKLVRPYLETYVQVGANAVVIGDVHIGHHVKIGAGAVVAKSVPDNCVVVGNPARIIFKDGKRVDIPL